MGQVVLGSHGCRGYPGRSPAGALDGSIRRAGPADDGPIPGRVNSALRRAASRETSVNGRVSPLASTCRAFFGGGTANPRSGTWQSMPSTST